jgi:hypothetical protein
MNRKELIEAEGRDGDAADNELTRDAEIEAELLRAGFVNFSHQRESKLGMVVREEAGCSLLRESGNFSIVDLCDDEPLFDLEAGNGTAGFEMPLDMLVGRIDEDGGLISLWGDRRRFEPVPGESAVLFSFPMTAGRNLMLSENCRWGDYSHEQWHAQPGTTAGCAILPSIPGQRTGRAVCPCTEKTHWCGSFKLRSDVGSEPDQEEC